MRLCVCLCLLSLAGLVATTCGEEPARNPAPTAEQLIERLGSNDFRTREAASRALSDLGIAALPALRKAQNHPDPEVRRRLEELIPDLESRTALEPRRVTLKVTNRPVKDILAEITKQTGYKLALAQENTERDKLVHSFNFENLTFWEALDRVCDACGLLFQQNYGYGDDILRLQVSDQGQHSPYVYLDGAFRLVAQGFSYGRNIQFGVQNRGLNVLPQRGSEYLSFSFNLSVEPRLPLLNVGQPRLTVAEDEHKNSFLPTPANGNGVFIGQRFYYGSGYRSYTHHVQANLVWNAKDSRTIKLLKGVVPVTLLAEQKPLIVVDNVLKAKGKKLEADGTHLEVDDVGEAPKNMAVGPGKTYQVKLSLRDTKPDTPNDYTWVHTLAQRLELLDADGNKYQSRGYTWSETTPTSVKGATFTFGSNVLPNNKQPGPPAKLVFYAWIKRDHEVAFEFRDLPLP
jgi:hypothetical protein